MGWLLQERTARNDCPLTWKVFSAGGTRCIRWPPFLLLWTTARAIPPPPLVRHTGLRGPRQHLGFVISALSILHMPRNCRHMTTNPCHMITNRCRMATNGYKPLRDRKRNPKPMAVIVLSIPRFGGDLRVAGTGQGLVVFWGGLEGAAITLCCLHCVQGVQGCWPSQTALRRCPLAPMQSRFHVRFTWVCPAFHGAVVLGILGLEETCGGL